MIISIITIIPGGVHMSDQDYGLPLDLLTKEDVPPGLTLTNVPLKQNKHKQKNTKKINEFLYSCFNKKLIRDAPNTKPTVGKMLTLLNYDKLFEESLQNGARIINSDIMTSPDVAKEINEAVFSNNDGDLGFTATCECGKLKGNYYEGVICPLCHTKVSTAFADKLTHTCWIAVPDDMPPVIHPIVYLVLKKWSTFKINEDSLIDIILNPEMEMPDELKEVFPKQGFSYFYENFSHVMDVMLHQYPKTANKSSTKFIEFFMHKYKDLVFCRKLPILHSSLHVITKSGTIRCVDNSVKDALKTALNITYTSFTHKRSVTHDKFVDISLYTSYMGYVSYISSIGQHKLGDKFALLRHHLLGTRTWWSCRTVIVPHTMPVMADEVYIPWSIAVNTLKLEILNALVNTYNLDPTEAIYRQMRAIGNYDSVIAEIMDEMIRNHAYGGLPILLN